MNKRILIFLCLGILLISSASAFNFDNRGSFDKNIGKYGQYEITNAFGMGKDLATLELKENTDTCGQYCSAEKEIVLYEKGSLVDNVIFETILDDGSRKEEPIRNYQFYIKTEGEKVLVDDYETQCHNGEYNSLNGTYNEICERVKVGSHYEDSPQWTEYSLGDEVEAGTYTIKLEGEKKPSRSVDWIIESNGIWTTEWANWSGSSYTGDTELYYKLDGTTGDVIDSTSNGNDGTNQGATRGETGIINNSFKFTSTENDYIGTNYIPQTNSAFTWTAWVKTSATSGAIMSSDTGATDGVLLRITLNKLEVTSGAGGSTRTLGSSSRSINDGNWHFVAVVSNGTWGNIYVDDTGPDSSATWNPYVSTNDLWIGRRRDSTTPLEGYIDEVGVFSTNLSSSEILDIYNSGVGITYPFSEGQITINSPADDYLSSTNEVTFNATASITGGATLTNMSLWTNESGTWEVRNTTDLTGTYNTTTFIRTLSEPTLWSIQACDSDGDCGFSTENRTVFIDADPPIILVEYPNGTLDYGAGGASETLNVTFTDLNLDSCWYDYNGTNIKIDGCVSGVKNATTFILEEGNYNMTIYANDSVGNVNSSFIEWDYKVFENSFDYNNETRAGDQEDFTLNITLLDGYDLTSAIFHYGDYISYPSIVSDGQNRIISIADYEIPIYTTDTNVSVYFSLAMDDTTEIDTTNITQLANAIFLDNCSAYTYRLFNISLFDEKEKTQIFGDIEFNYHLLNKPAYSEINKLNLSFENTTNVEICSDINLTNQNFAQSIEVRYTSDGYVSELYNIQKADIGNETITLNLFDLNESDSTEFKVTYQDSTFSFVDGAIIQLQRKYISEDTYEVVEAPITSNEGVAVLHIDLDTNVYKATISKDGEILDTFDNLVFKCQSILTGDCEQKLLGEIDPVNNILLETSRDFTYSISESNDTVTISFSSPSGLPSLVNIQLTQQDQFGTESLVNKTITSSAGSVECGFNNSITESYLNLKIYKDGVLIGSKSYIIQRDGDFDFLGNNYFIVFILLLSLMGMALTSPEWIIINGVMTFVLAGAFWLLNGLNFAIGLGSIMWLVIASGILIFKLAKQEDR